ncbi:Ger(x)C family spore germination protein [Peribacillus alkalitolerans]|uniref:Ger(x)C family spore germination protein n=1 Tax=Peribacillus alkalitolerans TaxID=1550385 RepID=UPI00196871E0|nr:Ger(x)C family spore germination protein [Peribacillus alkalitolerans]
MVKPLNMIILIFLLIICTSCTNAKTLEKIGIITSVGYEENKDGKIIATISLLQVNPETSPNVTTVTSESLTSKGARLKANLETPKTLQSGQLRVALYNEKLAKNGFIQLADTLARDSSISDLVYLAVVEGSTKKLLEGTKKSGDISQIIFKELDQNIRGEQIPSTSLQETLHKYYSAGQDLVMPILKMEGPNVKITGLGVFHDDMLVGKITPNQSFFVKLINDRYKAGNFEMVLNKDDYPSLPKVKSKSKEIAIVLDTLRSKADIKLKDKEKLDFDLKVKLNARLLEINGGVNLEDPRNIKRLEKSLNEKIEKEIKDIIKYCKSKNSDVFGFGEEYRSSVYRSKLTKKKWHDMYKDIHVNVKVDFSIIRTGIVE